MNLSNLRPAAGATRERKRIGRGNASGKGTTAGKGQKGQQSRSGKTTPYAGFEGGSFPIHRRLAKKRGFRNISRVEYEPINVGDLARFDADAVITPELLLGSGLAKVPDKPVKVLAGGELDRALTVRAHKFSAAAAAAIVAAGGRAESLEGGEAAVGRRRRGQTIDQTESNDDTSATGDEMAAPADQD